MSKVISLSEETGSFKYGIFDLVMINIQDFDGVFGPVIGRIIGGEKYDEDNIYNVEVLRNDRNPEWAWLTRHSRYESVIDPLSDELKEDLSTKSGEKCSHLNKEAIMELLEEAINNKDNETYIELNNIYNKI